MESSPAVHAMEGERDAYSVIDRDEFRTESTVLYTLGMKVFHALKRERERGGGRDRGGEGDEVRGERRRGEKKRIVKWNAIHCTCFSKVNLKPALPLSQMYTKQGHWGFPNEDFKA